MNNKKKYKYLLLVVTVVLVAAISTGSTLAYLTASTNQFDNKFTASGSVKGRVLEPSWVEANAQNFSPGDVIDKDPIVDNETSDRPVYVGARIKFLVDVTNDSTDNYVEVTYDTFRKFVTLNGLVGTNWEEYTTGISDGRKYYIYTKKLAKDKDSGDTATVGTGNETTDDATTKLFTSVTVADVKINDRLTSGYATATDMAASEKNATNLVFQQFHFKIDVHAYGIEADDASGTSVNALDATNKGYIVGKLKNL